MFDVIIVGSGPAGLTAAIYATRANLKVLLVAGSSWGGQLMLTTAVENYPGFPDGIQGPDLMMAMRKQAEKFKPTIIYDSLKSTDFSKSPFKITVGDKTYEGKTVIIATGADAKMLGILGEKEFMGKGVSTCAVCDGAFFKEKDVVVVGGGDTAMEDGTFLTHFAKSVTIIHRRDEFKASHIMLERAKNNPKIKLIVNTEAKEVIGDQKVTGVKLFNNKTNKESEMKIEGFFLAIGHIPNSAVFKGIDIDQDGYVKVYDHYKTNIEGVFVAGDVYDRHYKQAVTAAGFGCAAALEAERWLSGQK